ncbi:formimidoylglutamate deiminase [Microbacteriaceae bacterium VKM Ac-2854]|nr:formimidoylglutamate deiminase [Microbacteriaceae bacterium VKM Ac-2854]
MNLWCETLVTPAGVLRDVQIVAGVVLPGPAHPDDLVLGTVLPGAANAHSHSFHRILRGRTHADGGTFWRWRERMYAAAASLDPVRYERLATAVFAEMLVNGWTAVGEFHYLHHPAGAAEHAMELALASAAVATGIRLTLLDTAYLAGGFGRELAPQQRAFGDGDAAGYLRRWYALRERLPAQVRLGAALHSVRAVPAAAIREIVSGLPAEVPLHIHVSEQPQENADCHQAHGVSPIGLLADLGALSPRTSLIHATHVSADDIALVASSGATVVMCPTTEADLGDGIGPARAFADAGVPIAIGSDQNAVVDPFLELRGLEAGERLASGQRGRFDPAELLGYSGQAGYTSLGLLTGDFVEIDAASIRTAGSRPEQLVLTATGADVRRVIVGGRVVVEDGRVAGLAAPAELLREALV